MSHFDYRIVPWHMGLMTGLLGTAALRKPAVWPEALDTMCLMVCRLKRGHDCRLGVTIEKGFVLKGIDGVGLPVIAEWVQKRLVTSPLLAVRFACLMLTRLIRQSNMRSSSRSDTASFF